MPNTPQSTAGTFDVPRLAAAIKQAYPVYANQNDSELVQKVITAHPAYAQQLRPEDRQRLGYEPGDTSLASQSLEGLKQAGRSLAGLIPNIAQAPEAGGAIQAAGQAAMGWTSGKTTTEKAGRAMAGQAGVDTDAIDAMAARGNQAGIYIYGATMVLGTLLAGRAMSGHEAPETSIRPGSSAPTEIALPELKRATPLSDAGKKAEPGPAAGTMSMPQAPGAITKGAGLTLDTAEHTWQLANARPDLVKPAQPQATYTPPEYRPRVEAKLNAVAVATETKPNPAAGVEAQVTPQRPPTASVAPPRAIVEAPVEPELTAPTRPEGQPIKNDPVFQQYAKDRDAFMAQEAAKRPAKVQPTESGPIVDQAVKRLVKASDKADMARRLNELTQVVTKHADNLDPDAIRAQAQKWSDQAEARRIAAAAPEKIASIADARGGKPFGQWERTGVSAEEAARIKAEGGQVPRPGLMDLTGKTPAERDVLHELFGHKTETVVSRDEEGRPAKLAVDSDEARAQLTGKITEWQNEKRQIMATMGDFPSDEHLDRLTTLTEGLEAATGLREKVAGKGLPLRDAAGVVRAPGVIPDIGQKTGNALMEKPQSSHFRKPTPEELESKAVEADNYARIYSTIADNLEKKRQGLPPAASVTPEEVAQHRATLEETGGRVSGQPVPELPTTAKLDPAQLESQGEATRLQAQLDREKNPAERDRLQATIQAFKKDLNPKWDSGFPPGETSARTREIARLAHQATEPAIAEQLRDAVVGQRLGSKEAAMRLYSRALQENAKNGLDAAMRIATRANERGFLIGSFMKDIHDALVPGRLPEKPGVVTKGSIREAGARAAQKIAYATEMMKATEMFFEKQPVAIREQFIMDMEDGSWAKKYAPNSKEYQMAQAGRELLDRGKAWIQQVRPGALRKFLDNYFPHDVVGQTQNAAQLNARVYPNGQAGLTRLGALNKRYYGDLRALKAAGLELRDSNPGTAIINHMTKVAHFVKGQEIVNDLVNNGFVQRFKSPSRVPDGLSPLDQRVAGPGKYAPTDIAKTFNRYFAPSVFSEHPLLDTIRIYNNAAQIAGVSISGYHAMLVSHEAFVTDLSNAIIRTTRGDFLGAAKDMGRAAISPLNTMMIGNEFYKRYKSFTPEQIRQDPILNALMEGGGRVGISALFDTRSMRRDLRTIQMKQVQGQWVSALQNNRLAGMVNSGLKAIPNTMRLVSSPIQDYLVPRMKLGATVKMIQLELERLGPGASHSEKLAAMRNAVDSADNRFGQMVTDNLFMSKYQQAAAAITTRYFSFNFGSARELFGSIKDVLRALFASGISPRLAHTLAYAPAVAIATAMLGYMMGQPPKEPKDYLGARTGQLDAHGQPIRMMWPSYTRSNYELGKPLVDLVTQGPQAAFHSTADVALSRMSPALTLGKELYSNRTFSGERVIDPNATAVQKTGQYLKEVFWNVARPMAVGNWQRTEEVGGRPIDKALSVAGFQQVPQAFGLNQTPAMMELQNQFQINEGGRGASPDSLARFRALNKVAATERNNPSKSMEVFQQEVAAGHLKQSDMKSVYTRLDKNPLESVKELPLGSRVAVLEKASSEDERAEIGKYIKPSDFLKMAGTEAQKEALWKRYQSAMEGPK